jgi:hypothetical protein
MRGVEEVPVTFKRCKRVLVLSEPGPGILTRHHACSANMKNGLTVDGKSQQAVRVGIRVTTDQAMSRGRLYRLVHAVNPTNVACLSCPSI